MDNTYSWYEALKKPFFAPPSWLFGAVWTILYPIIIYSFAVVFFKVIQKKWPVYIAYPFIINAVANIAFTPIQFTLKNNMLAAIDITIVIITLLWGMYVVYHYSKKICYMQIPYLLWGLFATVLQYWITLINR